MQVHTLLSYLLRILIQYAHRPHSIRIGADEICPDLLTRVSAKGYARLDDEVKYVSKIICVDSECGI
jgi:hypothetical protein